MGSFERKMKRNRERLQFNDFTNEWFRAKKAGKKAADGKELGNKPGFSEYKKRLKLFNAIQESKRKVEEEQKKQEEQKLDLEWKEQ